MSALIDSFLHGPRLMDATVVDHMIRAINKFDVDIVTKAVYQFYANDAISIYKKFINPAGCLVTVPSDRVVTFPIGANILFEQSGIGTVTVQGDGNGVIINGPSLATTGQFEVGLLVKTGINLWTLAFFGGSGGGTLIKVQRSVTLTPVDIFANDQILNCNINVPATCLLPDAASRLGNALTFKDVGAQFKNNNLVITASGADLIDNAANITLAVNRMEITLTPFNDGVNTGWFIG